MSVKLGNLKRVSPREVWPSEARDFTPWLSENIRELGNTLGMDLEVVETEAAVGEFSVDILARDLATGMDVIVENQFGSTDHDHLGKLLTYAGGFDAFALVWIAESVRDEHRQALEWLNDRTDDRTSAFALELEVLQIEDSPRAFNFKPVVVPNKWQKTAKAASQGNVSPKGEAYKNYFQKLIDELRDVHHFTGAKVAFAQNWYSFASGISGITYGTPFVQGDRVRVELYIDLGDAEANKKLFDWLLSRRTEIETKAGMPLEWERLDDRQASRIAVYRAGNISNDEQTLTEIRSWAIKNLLLFKKVFGPLLKEFKSKAKDLA